MIGVSNTPRLAGQCTCSSFRASILLRPSLSNEQRLAAIFFVSGMRFHQPFAVQASPAARQGAASSAVATAACTATPAARSACQIRSAGSLHARPRHETPAGSSRAVGRKASAAGRRPRNDAGAELNRELRQGSRRTEAGLCHSFHLAMDRTGRYEASESVQCHLRVNE